MTAGGNLRDRLAQTDPEYQQLLAEHHARELRLDELKAKGWLTTEEEQEEKRLKKEKLQSEGSHGELAAGARDLTAPDVCRLPPKGIPTFVVPAVAGVFAWLFGYPPVAVALWLIGLFSIAFFRDPRRSSDAAADAVLAPADGKVLGRCGAGQARRDGPSAPGLDLHVAGQRPREPRADLRRRPARRLLPGAKLPAFRDKASELNEHSFVVIEGPLGTVAYKQIAGAIARRVVCDLAAANRRPRAARRHHQVRLARRPLPSQGRRSSGETGTAHSRRRHRGRASTGEVRP